jgi:hypothetical protein
MFYEAAVKWVEREGEGEKEGMGKETEGRWEREGGKGES